jgi:hypothetical protein
LTAEKSASDEVYGSVDVDVGQVEDVAFDEGGGGREVDAGGLPAVFGEVDHIRADSAADVEGVSLQTRSPVLAGRKTQRGRSF